jgi:hypothetical protein
MYSNTQRTAAYHVIYTHVEYCDMLLTNGACNRPARADAQHNYLRYSDHHPGACVISRPKQRLRET